MECPKEPNMADYYANLEISQDATTVQIKKAYRKMVLIHHPDKKMPGQTVDTSDFCRVQEAYGTLGDISKRRRYDGQYGSIQSQWMTYRRALEQWRQAELQRAHQKTNRERERQLNAAKAAGERKRQDQEDRAKGEEKEKPDKAEKEQLAEERSRQAADRARAEFQKAAIARLRLMKETEAEARSAAVLEKARQQQTQKAQERLAEQETEHEASTETEAFKDVLCFLYWMLDWLPSS